MLNNVVVIAMFHRAKCHEVFCIARRPTRLWHGHNITIRLAMGLAHELLKELGRQLQTILDVVENDLSRFMDTGPNLQFLFGKANLANASVVWGP